MNPVLKQFHDTEAMRETVKAFMIGHLQELAVDRVFTKQAIAGIFECRKVIDNMFNALDEMFMDKPKKIDKKVR